MPVYTPNIPLGTTNLSVSQGLILGNFQSIDSSVFGFTREHVTMTDGSLGGLHTRVTIGQTASAPTPLPAVGYGEYYTTRTGVGSGATPLQTQGVYKNGDGSGISIFSAIKAWGYFTINGSLITFVDAFNINATITQSGSDYSINFLSSLPNINYAIIVYMDQGGGANVASRSTGGFVLRISTGFNGVQFVVLQS